MAYSKERKSAFSVQGFRARRLNPDGSYPDVDNHIGFTGTVDTDECGATDTLLYREDGKGDFTIMEVDLSDVAAEDTAAVTVDEMVTALNADAAFTAIFTASNAGGRLKIVLEASSGVTYLELKGDVADVLGIGASGHGAAMGTAFVNCFDDSAGFQLPKNMKDYEEIEMESGDGTVSKILIDALMQGVNPSIAMTDEIYELKQMIQGGVWDDTEKSYTPPNSQDTNGPRFYTELFMPKYAKGTKHRGDMSGYKMIKLFNVIGHETDVSAEVKAWAAYEYECRASEWEDASGATQAAWKEFELTEAEFVAMI